MTHGTLNLVMPAEAGIQEVGVMCSGPRLSPQEDLLRSARG